MIANATAAIVQTPAARPSTPSEKLTTFIIATRPMTVTGPPAEPKSIAPRNGSVMLVASTPPTTGMIAAAVWPSSLTAGCRSKRSSTAPTSVISAAPSRMPTKRSWVRAVVSMNSSPATSAPAKMARPPSSGVDSRPRPRALGWSTAPTRWAKRAVSGVRTTATANAATNA